MHGAPSFPAAWGMPDSVLLKGPCVPRRALHAQMCGATLTQVATNKRYAAASGQGFTVSECAKSVKADFGNIDIIVHSLANGPEVTKALLETSRKVRQASMAAPQRHTSTSGTHGRFRQAAASHASVCAKKAHMQHTRSAEDSSSATSRYLQATAKDTGTVRCLQGYLAAISASAYSFVSMLQRFGPIMNPGGAAICLTYLASERIIPGLG